MDSGAYFTGRTWGRRPLAPRLSPKKTWEGAAGGFLAGVIAAVLFFSVAPLVMNAPFHPRATIVLAIGYGIVLSLAGILGDLAESLLKRDADRKDSSNWLPGLGGTLDVLDSLFWAAPAAYVYWMLVMPPS
jgi:phosphatidate cytidylyltransferase